MIIPLNLGEKSYDIVLERGAIKKVAEIFSMPERKVMVVTDSGVPAEYAKTVASQFEKSYIYTFPEGEESKCFVTYEKICQKLLDCSFSRKDCVIAVGGGVVGDMSGFAAATYMRGIDFYNIPTTVLSQVDSSIGGKTAIDLGKIKNIIGAFYQPKKVIIDPEVLKTLPKRQISNGLAESLKMGITSDEKLFEIFEKNNFYDKIDEIIERSLKVKKYVVEQDEKEQGLRKVLNFGHTIGHGIEASEELSGLYHGECVALGILPMCSESIRPRIKKAIENIGLKTEFFYDKERVFEALCHDKKSDGNKINIVKCEKIGSFVFEKVDSQFLKKLL